MFIMHQASRIQATKHPNNWSRTIRSSEIKYLHLHYVVAYCNIEGTAQIWYTQGKLGRVTVSLTKALQ